jgi:hypothetical protein
MTDETLTISQFCAAEKLSRDTLYKLWRHGKGPRWFNIGAHRRISHEARQAWRRGLEAEAAVAEVAA